jgi:ArsR family transcriptional regulator
MKFMSNEFCCVTVAPMTESESSHLADALGAIADPVRLRILSMVASAESGELCACDIPAAVGRSQPTVSHHLKLLAEAGFIEREQRGKWAWFRLKPERLEQLRTALAIAPHTATTG